MNIESKLEEINDELKEFQKNVEVTFDRLVTNIQTPEVKEKVKHFKDIEISKISKNILQTIEVIDSPISVGLVGRYSHGKTALINNLFSIDTEYSLPEGEGIVTSKITKVEFDSKVSYPTCHQILRDQRKNKISIEALKLSVTGSDASSELVDYYSIKLATKDDLSRAFESKKINLIDMPGLGGAYFRDNEKTRKYIDNLDMLIVAVKITEIKEAARCIEPYINNLFIPIIPVLTFFDTWRENPIFVTCTNDEEALCKAKDLMKDLIPSLSKYEIRTIAVSSKTKYNIPDLQNLLSNFVIPQNFAIQKIKSETPEVFKRRINEISKKINNITIETENSLNKLERELQCLIPNSQARFESFEQFFKKQKNKVASKSKENISQCVENIYVYFKKTVQYIEESNNFDGIVKRISEMEKEVNSTYFVDLNDRIDNLFADFKLTLDDAVGKYVDSLDIDELRKQRLKQSALEQIENYQSNIGSSIEYKAESVNKFKAEKFTRDIVNSFLNVVQNPQVFLPVAFVIIVPLMPDLPFVGNPFKPFLPWVILIAIISVMSIALFSDQTNQFKEVKKKIISSLLSDFDKQTITNDSQKKFIKASDELLDLVQKELHEFTNPYSKDIIKISEGLKEFQSAVKTINKFLEKQVELLESEQLSQ